VIRVISNGNVNVEGQTFDFDIGRIKMKISRAEMNELIEGVERINYFALRDVYRNRADGCWDDGRMYEVEIM